MCMRLFFLDMADLYLAASVLSELRTAAVIRLDVCVWLCLACFRVCAAQLKERARILPLRNPSSRCFANLACTLLNSSSHHCRHLLASLLTALGAHCVLLTPQAALSSTGNRKDIYVMELALQRQVTFLPIAVFCVVPDTSFAKQLEGAVVNVPFLHAAACAAYQAYLRSYATHSKAVKRVLHIGQARNTLSL